VVIKRAARRSDGTDVGPSALFAGKKLVMLADGAGDFSKALGIEINLPAMGLRARRGLFTIEDNVVKSVELEQPGKLEVSSADACMLKVS
jgi:peroxiredoxin